ncbi:MAG TPA: hypothetical protein VMP89_12845 [Solirubrobacteraceae bacterium]|nr:hypothetical protein [Solirubrobacteraceae bacterium]
MDRQDSEAIADALRTAYEEEALFYQDGIATANGSAVLVELLTRKLSLMTTVNNRRANRRFGA